MKRVDSTLVHNNKYGYRGIYFDKNRNKFVAEIYGENKKGKYLGRYDTPEKAALAYDEAAIKEYGENAFLNFPLNGEKKVIKSRLRDGYCPKNHKLEIHGNLNVRGELYCKKCNNSAANRYYKKSKENKLNDPTHAE